MTALVAAASETVAAGEWTSLEIAKLAVGIASPLLVGVVVGLFLKAAGTKIENAQWSSRKLIEKRLALYETMAPKLNSLFCFFTFVGDFREVTPPVAIALKRELDKAFHTNRFLFSKDFERSYESFMDASFDINLGVGSVAQPRTNATVQAAERRSDNWEEAWRPMLAPPEREVRARPSRAHMTTYFERSQRRSV